MRSLAGMGPGAYTDPTLTPGVTMIKAAHITDLRNALNAARTALMLPPLIFGSPTIVRAADVVGLRTGIE